MREQYSLLHFTIKYMQTRFHRFATTTYHLLYFIYLYIIFTINYVLDISALYTITPRVMRSLLFVQSYLSNVRHYDVCMRVLNSFVKKIQFTYKLQAADNTLPFLDALVIRKNRLVKFFSYQEVALRKHHDM